MAAFNIPRSLKCWCTTARRCFRITELGADSAIPPTRPREYSTCLYHFKYADIHTPPRPGDPLQTPGVSPPYNQDNWRVDFRGLGRGGPNQRRTIHRCPDRNTGFQPGNPRNIGIQNNRGTRRIRDFGSFLRREGVLTRNAYPRWDGTHWTRTYGDTSNFGPNGEAPPANMALDTWPRSPTPFNPPPF